jgi:hypothetical protein
MIGDGNALLENVVIEAAAGGTFLKSAEMVIVQRFRAVLIRLV